MTRGRAWVEGSRAERKAVSGYVNLVRSNGDIVTTLGITESQFGTMMERYIGHQ